MTDEKTDSAQAARTVSAPPFRPSKQTEFVIICAMEEEAEPFLEALEYSYPLDLLPKGYRGPARFHRGFLAGHRAVVATSGIGLTNAAGTTMVAVDHLRPTAVIIAGTTGGVGAFVDLNDVVLGVEALYHFADATAFGYVPGQIPQMPSSYHASSELANQTELALDKGVFHVKQGTIVSSNSFITAEEVKEVRRRFPSALAADMETAAIAQVCWSFDVPWLSVRAVSDLCDTEAGDSFAERAPQAANTSFTAVMALLQKLSSSTQSATQEILQAHSEKVPELRENVPVRSAGPEPGNTAPLLREGPPPPPADLDTPEQGSEPTNEDDPRSARNIWHRDPTQH